MGRALASFANLHISLSPSLHLALNMARCLDVHGTGITPFRVTMRAMKALLVALAVLVLAPEALASGIVWERKRVPVYDHTPDGWQGQVAFAVAEFNRKRSKRVPRLAYRDAGAPCRRHRRGVTVCEFVGDPRLLGEAVYRPRPGGVLVRVLVRLGGPAGTAEDDVAEGQRTVCHELFHALTGAPERKVPNEPCPYHEGFARKVYRRR